MVVVSSGFVHGMSPMGGRAVDSGGLGGLDGGLGVLGGGLGGLDGGLGGLGGGLGGLGGFSRTLQQTLLNEQPYGVTGGGCASAQRKAKWQPLGDGGEGAGKQPCHCTERGRTTRCVRTWASVLVASCDDVASAQEV